MACPQLWGFIGCFWIFSMGCRGSWNAMHLVAFENWALSNLHFSGNLYIKITAHVDARYLYFYNSTHLMLGSSCLLFSNSYYFFCNYVPNSTTVGFQPHTWLLLFFYKKIFIIPGKLVYHWHWSPFKTFGNSDVESFWAILL